MADKKYPKQPHNPDRKPSESVTWVRNLSKILDRKVVVADGKYKVPIVKTKRP